MYKKTTTITYGKDEIEVTDMGADKVLSLRGNDILLSQLVNFRDNYESIHIRYTVGNRILISENYRGEIVIGCLKDSKTNFNKLLNQLA
tara:strand:+ start:11789 stop:12055 length:267 start_codon:yes stop_codon:yes gene_type:complete